MAAALASAASFGRTATYFPAQQRPFLAALPSSGSLALDYGAFIIPVNGLPFGVPGIGGLLSSGLIRQGDLLSMLGLPDFLRGRAEAARPEADGVARVERVLGEQAQVSGLPGSEDLAFGELPLVALGLVLLSSFLLVGAVLPPAMVARTPFSPTSFARVRQPLALAAIGILVPVAAVSLFVALS